MWRQRICSHLRVSPSIKALISLPIEQRQLRSLHRQLFIPEGVGITGLFSYCQRLYAKATIFLLFCKIRKVLSFRAFFTVETLIQIRAILSFIMDDIIYPEQKNPIRSRNEQLSKGLLMEECFSINRRYIYEKL